MKWIWPLKTNCTASTPLSGFQTRGQQRKEIMRGFVINFIFNEKAIFQYFHNYQVLTV